MKRSACIVLAGILASSLLPSMSYYVLELRGGSHIYATDPPVRKGRLTLFHRYPDGVYMSVSSSEVLKIEAAQEPPRQTEKLAPGSTVYIGSALFGPSYEMPPGQAPAEARGGFDYGSYGYADSYWGGYVPPSPPVPPPAGRSNIGPNGFPIIAPPGSPGSVPPPIGANGFPILAPQPPVASPRRP